MSGSPQNPPDPLVLTKMFTALGENLLPGSYTLFFSLSPYTVEVARELSGVAFTSTLIPFKRAPLS